MSFIRIFAPAFFLSVIASQAIAAGGQIEIAQFGPNNQVLGDPDQRAAVISCVGKTVDAACSYHSVHFDKPMNGTCKRPALPGMNTACK